MWKSPLTKLLVIKSLVHNRRVINIWDLAREFPLLILEIHFTFLHFHWIWVHTWYSICLSLSLSLSLSLIRYGGVFILEFIFLVWGSPFTNERDLSVCLVHWIRIATWIIIFITGNKICRNWKTKHTHTLGYIYIYIYIIL